MPYPVVSGYLSGVGLIIILSQVPKFLGAPQGALALGLRCACRPSGAGRASSVGAVTVAVMLAAPKVTKAVPAAILGLAAGVLAYFGLGLCDRSLLELAGNPLVVGPLERRGRRLRRGDRRRAGGRSARWACTMLVGCRWCPR